MNVVGPVAVTHTASDDAEAEASSTSTSVNSPLALLAANAIDPDDYYIARVGWWPDNTVMVQIQNRSQKLLQVRGKWYIFET